MLYLFNDQINTLMFALNGGMDVISARGNRISFATSLLECLPMFELVILAFLLWRIGITPQTETVAENSLIEGFADNN
jgi:hypothetical protein